MYVCMYVSMHIRVCMYACMILRLCSIMLSCNLLNCLDCQFGAILRLLRLTFGFDISVYVFRMVMAVQCGFGDVYNGFLVSLSLFPKLDVVLFYTSLCWCQFLQS
jgi:small basic protein